MFIRLYYSSIWAFDTLKCTCLSVRCYIEPEACVRVRACIWCFYYLFQKATMKISYVFVLFDQMYTYKG